MNTRMFPDRILFLARNEESVRMDLISLKNIGIQSVAFLSSKKSAIMALEELESRKTAIASAIFPKIILCDEYLQDGTVTDLLYAIAHHSHLYKMPILVISGSHKTTKSITALGISVLERPYAQKRLANKIEEVLLTQPIVLDPKMFTLHNKKKTHEAEKEKKMQYKRVKAPLVSDWCKKGMTELMANNLQEAEKAFNEALARQRDCIEAYLGLAAVQNKLGNEELKTKNLIKAAAVAVRKLDTCQAKAIQEKLPLKYQHGSIFVHEGVVFLEEQAYRSAAFAFKDAARAEPGKSLQTILARACLFTPQPETSLRYLCKAYEKMGDTATARSIRQRLLNEKEVSYLPPNSWLDSYPLLRDVLTVASFTASAWRQAE